jgi:hypothetical protein
MPLFGCEIAIATAALMYNECAQHDVPTVLIVADS